MALKKQLRRWWYQLKRLKRGKPSYSGYQSARVSWDQARILRALAILGLVSVVGVIFSSAILFAWFARDLPNPNQIVRRDGFSTKLYDRNGLLLYDVFNNQNRISVDITQVPDHLKQATVAIEDKDFYRHQGFDLTGLIRGFSRLFTRGRAQGGSTLTQQLVKNGLLTSERSLPRKIKEFVLAVQIERKFTKDQILQMYLNEVPYGGTAWGVAAASETYFGKDVKELTLLESAILAGLPQRPSVYSPFGSQPTAYIDRTKNVLRRMREDGYITKEQEEESLQQLSSVTFTKDSTGIRAPHFVFYVISQLEAMYGQDLVEQGGLRVTTTLDAQFHDEVQQIVTAEIDKLKTLAVGNGAALVMDPRNGEILAMVGSKDYGAADYDGQVNVTLSLRQPGSTIKPVTYATAFNNGFTPASMLLDTKTEFPGGSGQPPYIPENYNGSYHGPVSLRASLGSSLNITAVKLLALVGLKDMLTLANELGLETLKPSDENLRRFGLSVTLGGGEVRLIDLVEAYSSFANGGLKVEPISILKVESNEGKALFEHRHTHGKRVLDEKVAFLINDILKDNNARLLSFGANSLLNMGNRSIAVKTGTTNDRRDNWTVGWSSNAVVGVWVGNNDNSPMKNVASGVTGASPIWRNIILKLWEKEPGDEFVAPQGVESVFVDQVSGYPEHDGFPSKSDYVIEGTLPALPDPIHAKLKLCRGQKKLATVGQIASGNYDEKEYFIFAEDDPFAGVNDENKWQKGINEWLATQGDERYHPPTEKCEGGEKAVVRINKPEHQKNYDSNEIEIDLDVFAEKKIEKVEILINGSIKESFNNRPYSTKIKLDPGAYELQGRARLEGGEVISSGILKFGLGGVKWDTVGTTPTPTPSPTPTATPLATP